MSAVIESNTRPAATRGLTPARGVAARQILALRDLRDAAALWQLCWTLAWLDIKQRYRGSVLGPFWLTISTGVMVGAMGLIYSTLFNMDLHLYLPFLTLSLVLWNFLATLVTEACAGYTASETMIRSVRMPYSLYAARIVVRNVLVLAHNLLVIVVVYAALLIWPGVSALLSAPGFALWLVDTFALSVILGALCARFRDILPIVGSVMQMAFFVTPVIWRPELLGAQRQWILPFNPFFTLLEIVRGPLMGEVPSLGVYVSAVAFSAVLVAMSWLLFARVRGRIAFWV